jgi:hypothetical protein
MSTAAATVAAPRPAAVRWRRDRIFYTALAILLAFLVFVGFAPTYYLKAAFGRPALAPLYHVHGFLFTCWMLLLIVQTSLVAARRTDIHRRLGIAGGWLAAAMMIAAVLASRDLGRRGTGPPGIDPLSFLLVPFASVVVFPVLVGAALALRRKPELHKRLMLIATLELVPAGVARWAVVAPLGPLAYFGLTDLAVVAMLVYDRTTTGRFNRATVLGGAFLVASQIGRIMLSTTPAWLSFARLLTS